MKACVWDKVAFLPPTVNKDDIKALPRHIKAKMAGQRVGRATRSLTAVGTLGRLEAGGFFFLFFYFHVLQQNIVYKTERVPGQRSSGARNTALPFPWRRGFSTTDVRQAITGLQRPSRGPGRPGGGGGGRRPGTRVPCRSSMWRQISFKGQWTRTFS